MEVSKGWIEGRRKEGKDRWREGWREGRTRSAGGRSHPAPCPLHSQPAPRGAAACCGTDRPGISILQTPASAPPIPQNQTNPPHCQPLPAACSSKEAPGWAHRRCGPGAELHKPCVLNSSTPFTDCFSTLSAPSCPLPPTSRDAITFCIPTPTRRVWSQLHLSMDAWDLPGMPLPAPFSLPTPMRKVWSQLHPSTPSLSALSPSPSTSSLYWGTRCTPPDI